MRISRILFTVLWVTIISTLGTLAQQPPAHGLTEDNPQGMSIQWIHEHEIKHVTPVFPKELTGQAVNPNVSIQIVVGPDGKVRTAKIIVGNPPALANAGLAAAKATEFHPLVLNGNTPLYFSGILTYIIRDPSPAKPNTYH
jgi:outer membrane biosynthesis protein TonB